MSDVCKVLVVEDDADTREALAAVLESHGFRVAEAEDGVAALSHLRGANCVCLIVLDLFMPKMNGWTFRQEQVKDPARAEGWIRKALADKARVMGFGHRVYRVEDPRAKHLRRLATELGRQAGDDSAVQILTTIARVVQEQKQIYPNVDLFSGAAYGSMGIATDQFTPIFALSRVAGWAAHVLEQHGNNRLIRPRAEYTGPTRAEYVPIDRR